MRHLRFPLLTLALVSGCQTYDFEPVIPTALSQTSQSATLDFNRVKPNVMLLVDRSGSMQSSSTCGTTTCTRLAAVKQAMGNFLTANPTIARFGLARFPKGGSDECAAASAADIVLPENVPLPPPDADDDATLQAATNTVNSTLQGITAAGATPTGNALRGLASYTPLLGNERADFALLLTDGLPNCNTENPNTCADMNACQCTRASCTGGYCVIGCLDQDGTVAAAAELAVQGVRTIVVGFGADLNGGTAFDVLNAVSAAGGFGRPCALNSDCDAGDTCNTVTKQCDNVRFYRAQDSNDLATVLAAVSGGFTSNPCLVRLNQAPDSPDLLGVSVNGASVPPGPSTWQLQGQRDVEFFGDVCAQLTGATPTNPVTLEFRMVTLL